ncbi:LuxR family transcriptional regulator [Rhizobiaceae bacterium BDR2-2]|uniref:LuxR family transcriptional regulator n=1 Tax=Ectorhizobium quercum TaxID=2965071 RepID=A0AAE3MZG1_9HYPH|nr:LuxR C-terminal-related transcriptional regulator [Ectorhizobium quercum]MCX8998148.1 LuxR family transcriptional regulator [Ectorhizobium quercum]
MDRLRRAVPFDYIVVSGLDFDNYRHGSGASIDADLPPAFLDAYYADGLLKFDPFVNESLSARGPLTEAEVYGKHPMPERLRYLKDTFGIHNRTLFPLLRGDVLYGAVTFSRATPFDEDEIAFFSSVATATYAVIAGPILEKFQAQTLRLSEGEVICLRLSSQGRTSEAVAAESGYAVDTVNTYIKSAIKKLGAANRVHGVAEAIRRGLIE